MIPQKSDPLTCVLVIVATVCGHVQFVPIAGGMYEVSRNRRHMRT